MTKSPTESELVAYSFKLGLVQLVWEFMCFLLGKLEKLPITYQDSTSVISLVMRDGGITRMKHLHARMNLVKQSLKLLRSLVEYLSTKEMPADGASKVLEGKAQKAYADFVLGVIVFNG